MPPNQRPKGLHTSPQLAPPAESKFEVTAQILSLDPGLYSIDISAPQTIRGISGMIVPCVRIDPLRTEDNSRAFVSNLSDSPLIRPGDHPSYLRIEGAKASVLLTIYKLAGGMAAPELQITALPTSNAHVPKISSHATLVSEPLTLLAHVERAGDVTVQGGVWAGQPGSRSVIEGFSLTLGGAVKADEIEYQAVLGSDWMTPWLSDGEFCGSRGLSLPLLGARIRLRGNAAELYSVAYWGSFIGAGEVGPIADGVVCSSGGAPLEALRIVLKRLDAGPETMQRPLSSPMAAAQAAPPVEKSKARPAAPVTPPSSAAKSQPEAAKNTKAAQVPIKAGRK